MDLDHFRRLQQTDELLGCTDSDLVNQLGQEDLLALQADLRQNHSSMLSLLELVGVRLEALEHVHG